MMRRAMMSGLAATALLLLGAPAEAQTCTSDDDCAADQYCAMKDVTPCLPPTCDPDDANCTEDYSCPEPEGECADEGTDPSQDCTVDADCADGFVCEAIGGSGCACPDGADCSDCEPQTFYGCVPAPCEADADCGDGLVCITEEYPCAVTTPACPPGEECPEPAPCEPETESRCAPAWVAPCETAADCGAGFDCVADEVCACSGGGGTGTDGGTDVPPPTDPAPQPDSGGAEVPADGSGSGSDSSGADEPSQTPPEEGDGSFEEDCVCEPSDEKRCEPQKVECASAVDCPEGWSCMETTAPAPSGCAATPGGDYECEEPASQPESAESFCVPPYFDDYDEYAGGGSAESPSPNGAEDGKNAGGENPPVGSDGQDGSLRAGGGSDGGCQGGALPTSLLPLALLALVAVLRRRIA